MEDIQNDLRELITRLAFSLREEDLDDPQLEAYVMEVLAIVDPQPGDLPPEVIDALIPIKDKLERFQQGMAMLGIQPTVADMARLAQAMQKAGLLNPGDLNLPEEPPEGVVDEKDQEQPDRPLVKDPEEEDVKKAIYAEPSVTSSGGGGGGMSAPSGGEPNFQTSEAEVEKDTAGDDPTARLTTDRPSAEFETPTFFFKARDDWKKLGVTFHHETRPETGSLIITPTDREGFRVGHFAFGPAREFDTHIVPLDSRVYHEEHRRKGIASHAYQLAEHLTGKKLKPSLEQSGHAKKLWAQPGRPFGKSERFVLLNEHLFKAPPLSHEESQTADDWQDRPEANPEARAKIHESFMGSSHRADRGRILAGLEAEGVPTKHIGGKKHFLLHRGESPKRTPGDFRGTEHSKDSVSWKKPTSFSTLHGVATSFGQMHMGGVTHSVWVPHDKIGYAFHHGSQLAGGPTSVHPHEREVTVSAGSYPKAKGSEVEAHKKSLLNNQQTRHNLYTDSDFLSRLSDTKVGYSYLKKNWWEVKDLPLGGTENEMDKSMSRAAATTLAAMAIATGSPAHTAAPFKDAPRPVAVRHVDLHPELKAISMVESSGGKNIHHKMVRHGLNAGHTAAGWTGLMPITARETISKNHDLALKHGKLLDMSPDQLTAHLNKHPEIEHELANRHWQKVTRHFPHDAKRRAYAWQNGIEGARHASHDEINKSPYVQKFLGYLPKPTPAPKLHKHDQSSLKKAPEISPEYAEVKDEAGDWRTEHKGKKLVGTSHFEGHVVHTHEDKEDIGLGEGSKRTWHTITEDNKPGGKALSQVIVRHPDRRVTSGERAAGYGHPQFKFAATHEGHEGKGLSTALHRFAVKQHGSVRSDTRLSPASEHLWREKLPAKDIRVSHSFSQHHDVSVPPSERSEATDPNHSHLATWVGKSETMEKVSERYKEIARNGFALMHPVKINGKQFSPENVKYHSTIKVFHNHNDHEQHVHQIAQSLHHGAPDPKTTTIHPKILHDRNGDVVHTLELGGPDTHHIAANHNAFHGMGYPESYSFKPHITLDEPTWQHIKQKGHKTLHEAGIEMGKPELWRGFRTVKRYG
jgi:GNAT superfamily N-acetyltransferase